MGATKLMTAAGGGITLDAASTASDKTITLPADTGTMALTSQLNGFRNRIINGDMRIDQRNAGASGTATGYNIDRWAYYSTQASKGTWQQTPSATETGYATRVGAGFTNYLSFTSSSAYSVISSDYFLFEQRIEGNNASDLAWGTANAKTVTISFWVYSSLTGTFGGSIRNAGTFNYSYPFTFTINAANTWEYKTITVTGPTAGTWGSGTSGCISLAFGLGVGSTYSGTANTWSGSNYISATGATSVVGTNGATFYITGVQLEKGTVATGFDYRPYGTELALCQRYCVVYGGNNIYEAVGYGFSPNSTSINTITAVPVPMRSVPSVSASGSFQISDGATGFVIYVLSISTNLSGNQQIALTATSTGLTSQRGYRIESANTTSARITFSAEL